MAINAENYPITNLSYLYKYGLQIQNSSISPQTKLSVLSGICRDSRDIIDIRFGDNNPSISGSITSAPVRIDNTVNGAGGIDEGTVLANTIYAIYIIADSRGYFPISAIATIAINIHRAPRGPLVPFGYDSIRLIGFWATDSSAFWLTGYYSGLSNDLIFTYDSPQATSVISGSSNTYETVNLYNLVPDIERMPVSIYTEFSPSSAADTLTLASGRSTASNGQVLITGQVSSINVTNVSSIIAQTVSVMSFPLPVPGIQYKVSGSSTVSIYVSGFSVSV